MNLRGDRSGFDSWDQELGLGLTVGLPYRGLLLWRQSSATGSLDSLLNYHSA